MLLLDQRGTRASITRTTAANPALLSFTGACTGSDAAEAVYMNFTIDGTTVLGSTNGIIMSQPNVSEYMNCSLVAMSSDLTAGSHTFKFQWARASGTGTLTMVCGTTNACQFWVAEVTD